MPQLHLYVPDETAERLRERAEERKLSLSRYLAEIVSKEVSSGWPEGYFESVVGSITDETFRRPEQPELEERLPFDSDQQH